MPKPRLTKKQRQLVTEIKQLLSTLILDLDEIVTGDDPEAYTPYLEAAKDQLVRAAVILQYVLMDEFLNMTIRRHFFGKKRTFPQLWRTKRFRTFNHFVNEKLYLLQKLDLVRDIRDAPKWADSDLRGLNDLRNALAHSFFLEHRRRKPEWKGQSVLTVPGLDRFLGDISKLTDFFLTDFFLRVPSANSRENTDGRRGAAPPHAGAGK